MKYVNCRYCGFRISETEKSCPNCGHGNPAKAPLPFWSVILVFLVLLVFLFIYLFTIASPGYRINQAVFFGSFGISLVGGFILGRLIDRSQKKDRVVLPSHLVKSEETIKARLKEIADRNERLTLVRQNISEGKKSEAMKSTLSMLDKSQDALAVFEGRYRTRLWKISIIRWKNTLATVESGWQSLDYQGCSVRLAELKSAIAAGETEKAGMVQNPLSKTAEGRDSLKLITQAMKGCDTLYEQLTAQLARLAMKTAPQTKTEAGDIVRFFDTGNDIAAFMADLAALESDFLRLETEEKAPGVVPN